MEKEKIKQIIELLYEAYPEAACELNYNSPYELLVSTVLSAQTTDIKVNEATINLFKVANTPEKMVELGISNIKKYIKAIGLSNSKARYIFELSLSLLENYNGIVPSEMDDLLSLSGVGRKTANVVRSVAFRIPSMAVDTHVKRLANRIGFSKTEDVAVIEKDLRRQIEEDKWILAHHLLIFHGRRICKARNPECEICTIKELCKYYEEKKNTA